MAVHKLKTRIFLDSGDTDETKQALALLGFLDGQTTNPSLIAKNPAVCSRENGKCTSDEVYRFYREEIRALRRLLPQGSISVEVYADAATTADDIYLEAKEMHGWASGLHIKLPITKAGLAAGEKLAGEGVNLNFTLCFSQAQAAAVHAATRGARGSIFISPFIGRLDDVGANGVDLVRTILRMYREQKSHVQVLAASIRHLDHLLAVLQLPTDIATVPFAVVQEWKQTGLSLPAAGFAYRPAGLKSIIYETLDLQANWKTFNVEHELTAKGIEKFANDWNKRIL